MKKLHDGKLRIAPQIGNKMKEEKTEKTSSASPAFQHCPAEREKKRPESSLTWIKRQERKSETATTCVLRETEKRREGQRTWLCVSLSLRYRWIFSRFFEASRSKITVENFPCLSIDFRTGESFHGNFRKNRRRRLFNSTPRPLSSFYWHNGIVCRQKTLRTVAEAWNLCTGVARLVRKRRSQFRNAVTRRSPWNCFQAVSACVWFT